jgi:hypothetical protein
MQSGFSHGIVSSPTDSFSSHILADVFCRCVDRRDSVALLLAVNPRWPSSVVCDTVPRLPLAYRMVGARSHDEVKVSRAGPQEPAPNFSSLYPNLTPTSATQCLNMK